FTETMTGFFQPGVAPSHPLARAEYEQAERAGREAGRVLEFTLTITMPNLGDEAGDSVHAGVAQGVLRADGLTAPGGALVSNGVFQLFVPAADGGLANPADRRMIYTLAFVGAAGRPYLLDGVKI